MPRGYRANVGTAFGGAQGILEFFGDHNAGANGRTVFLQTVIAGNIRVWRKADKTRITHHRTAGPSGRICLLVGDRRRVHSYAVGVVLRRRDIRIRTPVQIAVALRVGRLISERSQASIPVQVDTNVVEDAALCGCVRFAQRPMRVSIRIRSADERVLVEVHRFHSERRPRPCIRKI